MTHLILLGMAEIDTTPGTGIKNIRKYMFGDL